MGGQVIWTCLKYIPHSPAILSRQDIELVPKFTAGTEAVEGHVRQQVEYESIHRDLNIGFGKWEFDPMEIENPFPNNEGSVHIWMGDEDLLVPLTLQRYIAQQIPWINYHELTGAGHMASSR
nr:putative alpha/beta hydrolase fold protein [Tanacetum cinerariifolium]